MVGTGHLQGRGSHPPGDAGTVSGPLLEEPNSLSLITGNRGKGARMRLALEFSTISTRYVFLYSYNNFDHFKDGTNKVAWTSSDPAPLFCKCGKVFLTSHLNFCTMIWICFKFIFVHVFYLEYIVSCIRSTLMYISI